MKSILIILSFLLTITTCSYGQKFYLNQMNDSVINSSGTIFKYDTFNKTYHFVTYHYISDSTIHEIRFINTDTIGNILNVKSVFSEADSNFSFKDIYRLSPDTLLYIGTTMKWGYKQPAYDILLYYMNNNYNLYFSKKIIINNDKSVRGNFQAIINKKGNLVITGRYDSLLINFPTQYMSIYFYELTKYGDSVLFKSYIGPNTTTTKSIVERNDSSGYVINSQYESYRLIHLDSNFNVLRKAADYKDWVQMGLTDSYPPQLVTLGNGYYLQLTGEGKKAKHWVWLEKFKDDMTIVKAVKSPAEPDTVLDFAHCPAPFRPIVYNGSNIYTLEITRNEYFQHFKQCNIQICKYDTALNLIWNRVIGNDDFSTFGLSIFEAENKNSMVLCTRSPLDTTIPIKFETFIFKLDSMGTVTSVINLSNPSQAEVYVYPNPATHTLHFVMQNIAEGSSIALYNLYGNKVAEVRKGNSPNTSIDIAQLPAGVYTYRISDKNKQLVSGKWVKE